MNLNVLELVKFVIVGAGTFFIDYGFLYVLTEYAGVNYIYSSGLSFTIAVIINYILCILVVFKKARNGYKQMILFLLSSIVGLGINQFCMWVLVEKIHLYYMIAKIVSTAIVTVWNYFTKKNSLEF